MRGCRRQHVILPLLLAWSAMTAMAREEATPADHALVDQVMHRLRAVAEPVAGFAWPPTFKVVPVIDGDEVSACAHNASKDYQVRPEIDVTDGLLRQVVDGNADRLAFVLGHELGHIVLKHGSFRAPTPGKTDVKTDVVKHVFSREEEIAADKKGMELTLAAGYSKKAPSEPSGGSLTSTWSIRRSRAWGGPPVVEGPDRPARRGAGPAVARHGGLP